MSGEDYRREIDETMKSLREHPEQVPDPLPPIAEAIPPAGYLAELRKTEAALAEASAALRAAREQLETERGSRERLKLLAFDLSESVKRLDSELAESKINAEDHARRAKSLADKLDAAEAEREHLARLLETARTKITRLEAETG